MPPLSMASDRVGWNMRRQRNGGSHVWTPSGSVTSYWGTLKVCGRSSTADIPSSICLKRWHPTLILCTTFWVSFIPNSKVILSYCDAIAARFPTYWRGRTQHALIFAVRCLAYSCEDLTGGIGGEWALTRTHSWLLALVCDAWALQWKSSADTHVTACLGRGVCVETHSHLFVVASHRAYVCSWNRNRLMSARSRPTRGSSEFKQWKIVGTVGRAVWENPDCAASRSSFSLECSVVCFNVSIMSKLFWLLDWLLYEQVLTLSNSLAGKRNSWRKYKHSLPSTHSSIKKCIIKH